MNENIAAQPDLFITTLDYTKRYYTHEHSVKHNEPVIFHSNSLNHFWIQLYQFVKPSLKRKVKIVQDESGATVFTWGSQ